MSDLSKYCVHLLGKEGARSSKRRVSPFQIMLYNRAVMAVGVGIYNGPFSRYEDGSPLLK